MKPDRSKFILEFALTDDVTVASQRSGYNVTVGRQLARTPEVIEAVAARKQEIAAAALFDAVSVLREWVDIATADPRELTAIYVYCCRYCWGVEHAYQWTMHEYALAADQTLNRKQPAPDATGGFGFESTREPHPECPKCCGAGISNLIVADTRKLSPKASKLYAGAKMTRNGLEIQMRNQDAALEHIARWLGMLVNKSEVSGPGGRPIPVAMSPLDLTDDQLLLIAAGAINPGAANADGS